MRKTIKLVLFLTILITNLTTFGQQQWGLKVNEGISRIYGQLESRNYPLPTTTTTFSPSFQGGIYCKLSMSKRSSIGTELLFSQVAGGQTFIWDYKGVDIEYYGSHITNEHISWLSLPVYYGVTFKRLTINGGFQISYVLSSSGRSELNHTTIITDENDSFVRKGGINRELDDLDIKTFDYGPRVGAIFRLTNRLSMEGMFYYGLNNINQLKSTEEALKIQQMTVGIRYAMWNKE